MRYTTDRYQSDEYLIPDEHLEEVRIEADTLLCPFVECEGQLVMEWAEAMALSPFTMVGALANPANAYTSNWQISCTNGHVVLLPQTHDDDNEVFGEECYTCHPDGGASNTAVYHDDLGRLRALLGMSIGTKP
jgi:hypothetical protein